MSESSSDASQQQITDTQDNRIASAVGSVNLVTSRSNVGNVNIQTTDHGAVDGAFKFANASSDSAFKFGDATVGKAFDFAKQISNNAADETAASGARSTGIATSAMKSVQDAYSKSGEMVSKANEKVTDTLAAAYETAKAGEQKIMVGVGLAIVGIVAVKALGKGA